ncbi:ubiquitin carboxyl-terminal hydrolase 14-like isoform X2 [Patiria miniata]|uniref:Ubiquitin carboxyl-terminal hydrolase n=1 Tax=Patiria miniata TaxID=46514 RepID=A0A913ZZQ8_PATMI|nr:ubiquitin carboxyl-terminal hydrolase 14-like isoform X2 [Patiria miniata]
MTSFKVNVKWGKEKFTDIECSLDESPDVFKAQIFALTGVQPERQKVMLKGATLKEAWSGFKVKNGITFLVMGSAEALPEAPSEKTLFMEDMTEEQLASAFELSAGLANLGNTCYLNSTVQCLHSIPELRDSLKRFDGHINPSMVSVQPAESITAAMRELFSAMEKATDGIQPIFLLQLLHLAFPQFAEKTEHGVLQQQDANECWVQLVRLLQQQLTVNTNGENQPTDGASASKKGFIDQYFGGKFDSSLKCVEAPEEEASKSTEQFLQLSCFISQDVKYLHTGLKNSRISRLPAYLPIQMVRFYYKEKENINAKILKDVKYPMVLDVFDLCTKELQEKLVPIRLKFKEMEDRKLEEAQKAKQAGMKQPTLPVEESVKLLAYDFPDDIGSNNSGYYELQAVLTHQGRSSSSGHYVGWVRKKGEEWIKFDDDNVTPVTSEDVLKLSGGGDWPCAYVLLYGPRRLEEPPQEDEPMPEK